VVEIQERVARLEGRVQGHAQMLTDVAAAVRHLDARMDRLEARMDERFTALDQKIGVVETRLEHKLDTHFRWLVGIQFAMFVALVASLAAIAG